MFVETIREISIGPSIVRALQNFKDPAILRLGIHLVLQVPHSTIQIEKNAKLRCKFDICRLIGGPEVSRFISTFLQPSWQISLRPWLVMQCRYFQAWTLKPCGRAMTDFGARPKRAMCLGSQMDLIFFLGVTFFKLLVVFTFTNSGGDRRTCAESVRAPRGFPSTV